MTDANISKLFDESESLKNALTPLKALQDAVKKRGGYPIADWLFVEIIWLMTRLDQQLPLAPASEKAAIKKNIAALKKLPCWQQAIDFDRNFPLLDGDYLHEQHVGSEIGSLSQFLAHPKSKDISPHPLFYVARYKIIEKINQTPHHPLVHFFRHSSGYRATSPTPNPYFDCDWYRENYLQDQPFKNPLLHYLANCHGTDIQPSPHFHNNYVRQTQNLPADVDPLAYYLKQIKTLGADFRKEGFSPCPYFDRGFYLATYQDIRVATEERGLDPFQHFCISGIKEDRKGHASLRHNSASPAMVANFSSKRRLAVLVLGMHRSGTSALTRIISLAGMDLPTNLMAANFANETGYWESVELAKIHDDILSSLDSSWDGILPIDYGKFKTAEGEGYKALLTDYIVREFSNSEQFVLKDPRLCKLVPLWLAVLENLNIEAKIVIPFRNPLEVAESLKKRDGFLLEKSFLLWLRHVLEVEQHTRKLSRCFVSYTQLLRNPKQVLEQIASQCGLQWPNYSPEAQSGITQFIDVAQYHQHATKDGLIEAQAPDWIVQAYLALETLAQDGNGPQAMEKLSKIAGDIRDADQLYGLIIADKDQAFQKMQDHYRHKQAKIRQHAQNIQQLAEDRAIGDGV